MLLPPLLNTCCHRGMHQQQQGNQEVLIRLPRLLQGHHVNNIHKMHQAQPMEVCQVQQVLDLGPLAHLQQMVLEGTELINTYIVQLLLA